MVRNGPSAGREPRNPVRRLSSDTAPAPDRDGALASRISAIARELGLTGRTVHKYARAFSRQEVVRLSCRCAPTVLPPYLDHLRQHGDEGEHGVYEVSARGAG